MCVLHINWKMYKVSRQVPHAVIMQTIFTSC